MIVSPNNICFLLWFTLFGSCWDGLQIHDPFFFSFLFYCNSRNYNTLPRLKLGSSRPHLFVLQAPWPSWGTAPLSALLRFRHSCAVTTRINGHKVLQEAYVNFGRDYVSTNLISSRVLLSYLVYRMRRVLVSRIVSGLTRSHHTSYRTSHFGHHVYLLMPSYPDQVQAASCLQAVLERSMWNSGSPSAPWKPSIWSVPLINHDTFRVMPP